MRYWVYVNKSDKRVRLHKSTCGHCKDGVGKHGHQNPKNCWWKDCFDSWEDAWRYAQLEAGKLSNAPKPCPSCKP